MLQKLNKEQQLMLYIEQQEEYYQDLLNKKDLHIQQLYNTVKDLGMDRYDVEIQLSNKLVNEIVSYLDKEIKEENIRSVSLKDLILEKPKSILSKLLFWKKN